MKKFNRMFLRNWRKSPLKISLTLVSVALGTVILVIALAAGAIVRDRVTSGIAKSGTLLYVANATLSAKGSLERVMPGEWDADAPDKVAAESGAVAYAAVVATPPFDEIAVEGRPYRLRSAVGTGPAYFDVFSIKLVAGVPMAARDVAEGAKKVWLSEELASLLFGSAEAAVGKRVQPPEPPFRRGPESERSEKPSPYYSVAGVFAMPGEVARLSYGIGDLVYPYTSIIPAGANASIDKRMMAGTFVVTTSVDSEKKAEDAIRRVLSATYPGRDGKGVSVTIWEGSSRGASTYLRQLRQTISLFSVYMKILGLVMLAISSLGIFSVMVVELLGRRREIALERAIGASRFTVVAECWAWSVCLSLFGALLGILMAVLVSGPVLRTIAPLMGEVSTQFRAAAGLTLPSILEGLLLALGCGGLLGALPALSAVRGSISETLREV